MFDISPVHLILLAAIALIVFGPRRLPEMARNLGRGVREFKSAMVVDDHAGPAPPQPSPAATVPPPAAHPGTDATPVAAPGSTGIDHGIEGFVRSGDDQPARPSE